MEAEQVLPAVAAHYLPGVLYILFAGALVSAILSTVDSCLLVAASLTSHNLVVPLLGRARQMAGVGAVAADEADGGGAETARGAGGRAGNAGGAGGAAVVSRASGDEEAPGAGEAGGPEDAPGAAEEVAAIRAVSERAKLLIARGFVVVYGIVAYAMAISAESVYGLVEEASSFGSAGIFVVAVAALFVPIGGRVSALAAILAGLGVWTLAAYALPAFEIDAGPVTEYPYLTSLAAALLGFVVPMFWRKPPDVRGVEVVTGEGRSQEA